MDASISNNSAYFEFDGVWFPSRYRSLLYDLKRNGITTLEKLRTTALYEYVLKKGFCTENDVSIFLKEFRTIAEEKGTGITIFRQWPDALGKIVPVYKIFNSTLRTVCSDHNIKNLYDLLKLPINGFSIFSKDSQMVKDFVEILRVMPVTFLGLDNMTVNLLHRNGIQTAEQLAMTGDSFIRQQLGADGSMMTGIINSLNHLPETVVNFRKTLKPSEYSGSSDGEKKTFLFDNEGYVLYVYKNSIVCNWNKHDVIDATGVLASLNGQAVQLNNKYCESCNKCFISLDLYNYYRKKYGPLLGNISFEEDIVPKGKGFSNMSDESPLHLCGYNVNKQENSSESQRHRILGSVMDHHILKKSEITDYLEFFIKNRKNNPNMKEAVRKWEEDLGWVADYHIDYQKKYLITGVHRY